MGRWLKQRCSNCDQQDMGVSALTIKGRRVKNTQVEFAPYKGGSSLRQTQTPNQKGNLQLPTQRTAARQVCSLEHRVLPVSSIVHAIDSHINKDIRQIFVLNRYLVVKKSSAMSLSQPFREWSALSRRARRRKFSCCTCTDIRRRVDATTRHR